MVANALGWSTFHLSAIGTYNDLIFAYTIGRLGLDPSPEIRTEVKGGFASTHTGIRASGSILRCRIG